MKKSLKVLVSLVLIFALLMSYAPSIVLAAPQSPACTRSAIYALKDVKLTPPFKSDGTVNTASVVVKEKDEHIMHFTLDSGSKQCYCIEPGAGLTIDSTIDSSKANKYWTALKNSSDPKHQKIVTGIYRVVALADHMNPTKDADVHAIAQIVLWEIICGIRDPITGEALKTTLQSSFSNFATTDQETYYTNRYKQFVTAYQQFDDIPSFMYSSKTTATSKPITLNWNATNKRYQATVTDSKGLLSKMNTTGVFPDYVNVSKSGNNLTLWTTKPITNALASSRINKNHGFSTSTSPSMLIYGGNLENGDTSQAVVASSVPDPMAGYMSIKTGDAPKTSITVTKTWVDDNDRDGVRPSKITVNLLADGTLYKSQAITAADGWKYTFSNLPEYNDSGTKIKYTISENAVPKYETSYNGFTIINTHQTGVVKTFTTKTWDDNGDQDGIRPDSITIRLYADGKEIDSKKVTEKDGWEYEFTNLPKYRDGGIEIKYEIKEDPIPGYETSYDGFDVINTHIPEKTQVSGTKTWVDNDNQDGYRPESITVRLYADGKEIDSQVVKPSKGEWRYAFTNLDKYRDGGVEIVYSIAEDAVPEYATTYDGFNITNTHITEKTFVRGEKTWDDRNNQDGIRPDSITVRLYRNGVEYSSQTVHARYAWQYEWTDLDKYEQGGLLVEWTVKEDPVEGYTPTYDGFNITNHYTPQTVEVSGQKRWDDNGNQDGVRPEQITVRLMRDGEEYDVKTVTAENEWKYAWSGLDKYRDGGEEIVWTVVEDAVPEYVTSYEGYNIVNTHAPAKTEIGGTKTWNDNNNQDGVRPEKITVRLYRDGEEFLTQEVTDVDGMWAYLFTDLDVYRDGGVKIEWTITEDAVEGYTTTYDGTNIINTHETATTDVAGFKTWVDDNDRDGLRPDQITVRLYRDGTEYDAKTVTAEDEWKYSWTGLDKYRDGGVEIKWTIDEDVVEGYTKTIDGFNLTNTHEIETITISGRKIWNDGSNAAELRPEAVMLTLCADGEEIDTAEVTMTDAESPDVWHYEFVDLPVYKAGKKVTYTVMEKPVKHYTSTIDGFDITNTIIPTVDSPKTGDNSRAVLPALMMVTAIAGLISGGACIALVIRRRKQKRNGQ